MPKVYKWSEFLTPGNEDVDRRTLRKYFDEYREEKGIPEQCAIVGCPSNTPELIWNEKVLQLELDHKNGNPLDNSPENLRLLCPNCHSQQVTNSGRNRNRVELLAEEGETPTGRSYVLHERDGTDHFIYHPTGFRSLPTLPCSCCKKELVSRDFIPNKRGGAPNASTFDSCLRRCDACGIGFSNTHSRSDVVCIYRTPDGAVPEQVRGTVEGILQQSMNVLNRTSKWVKFCSESSEDAVTWTVFSSLQRAGRLREIMGELGCEVAQKADAEPSMLLWGVPIPSDSENGMDVRNRLAEISDTIGEPENSRSEPDVVLDFGESGVVIVEVKHRSGNEIKGFQYRGWNRYFANSPAFVNRDEIRNTGMYELARNWRLAWDLADGRALWLLVLGPEILFADTRLSELGAALVRDDHRQFHVVSWTQVRAALGLNPEWAWLNTWLDDRGVG